jgi:hypothetical protein
VIAERRRGAQSNLRRRARVPQASGDARASPMLVAELERPGDRRRPCKRRGQRHGHGSGRRRGGDARGRDRHRVRDRVEVGERLRGRSLGSAVVSEGRGERNAGVIRGAACDARGVDVARKDAEAGGQTAELRPLCHRVRRVRGSTPRAGAIAAPPSTRGRARERLRRKPSREARGRTRRTQAHRCRDA